MVYPVKWTIPEYPVSSHGMPNIGFKINTVFSDEPDTFIKSSPKSEPDVRYTKL